MPGTWQVLNKYLRTEGIKAEEDKEGRHRDNSNSSVRILLPLSMQGLVCSSHASPSGVAHGH